MPGGRPEAAPQERLHAARCRWLCTLLYLGGMSAAEVLDTEMGALKEIFGMGAKRLLARVPEWEAQAALLAGASAHWLRPYRWRSHDQSTGRPALHLGQVRARVDYYRQRLFE